MTSKLSLSILLGLTVLAACDLSPPFDDVTAARGVRDADRDGDRDAEVLRGRALFTHAWQPDDPWSVDGNGLGPVFNASSCVACHAQGGVGGAGASHMNVRVSGGLVSGGGVAPPPVQTNALGCLGSSTRSSHALGGLGSCGFGLFGGRSARNTPALFGAGLIDSISEVAIDEGARVRDAAFPEVRGQVTTSPDGRIARFGWKGDVVSLRAFVSQACAAELGLTVPDAAEPMAAGTDSSPRLDLDDDGVNELTSFIASLPAPLEDGGGERVELGRRAFHAIGCASCHQASLDGVDGLYSDLLLHDMGPALSDRAGTYGQQLPETNADMWRTPPLWGVRDSGPWLHDGRATTLLTAINGHAGESMSIVRAFHALPALERDAVLSFLESLVAPSTI